MRKLTPFGSFWRCLACNYAAAQKPGFSSYSGGGGGGGGGEESSPLLFNATQSRSYSGGDGAGGGSGDGGGGGGGGDAQNPLKVFQTSTW